MLGRYVVADILRNPRRTLSTVAGVVLGVGLFCGVLFFIDGLSASMTQRAVAPVAIDMQRIVTERVGNDVVLTQHLQTGRLAAGERAVRPTRLRNGGAVPRQRGRRSGRPPAPACASSRARRPSTVSRSSGYDDNPFSHGPVQDGLNLGTSSPAQCISWSTPSRSAGGRRRVAVRRNRRSRPGRPSAPRPPTGRRSSNSRASPRGSDGRRRRPPPSTLSIADLGSAARRRARRSLRGPRRSLGSTPGTRGRPHHQVRLTAGSGAGAPRSASKPRTRSECVSATGSVCSLPGRLDDRGARIGAIARPVAGALALLESSRRRSRDLRVLTERTRRPVGPVRHAGLPGIRASRHRRDQPAEEPADPRGRHQAGPSPPRRRSGDGDARDGTSRVATCRRRRPSGLPARQHHERVGGRGRRRRRRRSDSSCSWACPARSSPPCSPGTPGNVLAEAQRREQATLRVRGASRRHLLRMLALRTMLLTAAGAGLGLVAGYVAAAAILGQDSLELA